MTYLKLPRIITFFVKGGLFVFMFFFLSNSLFAQNISVPDNIQAALLTKVLKYNPQIHQNEKIKILVVFNNDSQINKDEFIKGLGDSIDFKAINPQELEENISGYQVVYFMPGINGYSEICKLNNTLSVSGSVQNVEKGSISLGFGIRNSKPEILVNLTSLDQEEQSFSSDLLRIAKIFK